MSLHVCNLTCVQVRSQNYCRFQEKVDHASGSNVFYFLVFVVTDVGDFSKILLKWPHLIVS